MFKRLKRNILLFNLSILITLLLVIFASLYISTYQNIYSRVDEELLKLQRYTFVNDPFEPPVDDEHNDFTPDRSIGFVIYTNQDGEITNSFIPFTVADTFDADIISLATKSEGTLSFNDLTWAYSVTTTNDGTIYAFINITSDQAILNDLLIRYILILAGSILVVGLLSTFITNKSIKPLKTSFMKQKQFIADASHELKTPLTVIQTNLDVIDEQDIPDETSKWFGYIKEETKRMSQLTHDLLLLASMEEQQNKHTISESIDVLDIVQNLVLNVEALAFEKEVQVEVDIKQELHILFSEKEFKQVIMILLENAIKYTPKHNTITISLTKQQKDYLLSVTNTGIGIPKEDADHIFDRFYKVDKSRSLSNDSYGLGLSIAQAICENQDMKLHLETDSKTYTSFCIQIPKNRIV
jgi:signal transduction histidine kinase